MILDDIKNNFLEYVKNYDSSNKIIIKREHILRVAENCKHIAASLNLDDEYIKLAYLIGICHDIGRFEQVRLYNTFSDKDSGMDHGAYSNKVLFEDGLIRKFIQDDKYDEIIKKAVFNHNKGFIEPNLTDEELLFAKIVRDADKIDILRVITTDKVKDIFWYPEFKGGIIDKKFILKFYKGEKIDYKDFNSNIDLVIAYYEYAHDLYFKESRRIILESNYYALFNERLKILYNNKLFHEQLDNLYFHINDYLRRNV